MTMMTWIFIWFSELFDRHNSFWYDSFFANDSLFYSQLSKELGFPIVANAQLTFTKCLEMKLQDHIEVIAKVAEIAGKEYSIEQVKKIVNQNFLKFIQNHSE